MGEGRGLSQTNQFFWLGYFRGNNVLNHIFARWKIAQGWMPTLLGAAALTILINQFEFKQIENSLYDFRALLGHLPPADARITLISLEDSFTHFQSFEDHLRLLKLLGNYRPKAIGYLSDYKPQILANSNDQITIDSKRYEWGHELGLLIQELAQQNSLLIFGTPHSWESLSQEQVLEQIHPLKKWPHSDQELTPEGSTIRSAPLTLDGIPSFDLHLAQSDLAFASPLNHGIQDDQPFFFRRHRSPQGHSSPAYPTISVSKILNGQVPDDQLRGKILLVGPQFLGKTPLLLTHAHIIDSILHHQSISPAPSWANYLTVFFVVACVLGWISKATPIIGVLATISLTLGTMGMCHLFFQSFGIWIHESLPLIGIFVSFYVATPFRLIQESKARWELEYKNEILKQVEEMKTHFISLVTHDLKTPVARIQGLAELALKQVKKADLTHEQNTLTQLLKASDELDYFINRILELNRVESNQIKLKLESKDINVIIESVIERFKDGAQNKSIELRLLLESLFPIKIDAELIFQVVSNLVDNAIKYSPPGSTVEVETKEVHSQITITIRDQGIGLSEEDKNQIFTRFYRAKNEVTATTRGTGLGLYLSKYFIETHGGSLQVQSQIGSGSQFTISLPIERTQSTKPSQIRNPLYSKLKEHHYV